MEPQHRAIRAAREVAHAASHLASEAATLARVYDVHPEGASASMAASEAAVRAAKVALDLESSKFQGDKQAAVERALRSSAAALDAAAASVQSTRVALDVGLTLATGVGLPARSEI